MKTIEIIKKAIVLLLVTFGVLLILADSDADILAVITVKLVGIISLMSGVQLCAVWHLFTNYLNED